MTPLKRWLRLALCSALGIAGLEAQTGTLGPVSASPASGNGQAQTLTYTFTDSKGAANMTVVDILTNTAVDGRSACYIAYDNQGNVMYLVADSGTSLLPGKTPAPGMSLGNSQCTINSAAVTKSGPTLSLALSINYSTGFAGNRITYLSSRNLDGFGTQWIPSGVWGVLPLPATTPTAFALTPATAGLPTTTSSLFSATITDPAALTHIGIVNLLINSAFDGRNACYLAYNNLTNALYLVADDGIQTYSAGAPLTGAPVSNSQCTLDTPHTYTTKSSQQIVVNFSLKFASGFTGPKVAYLAGRNAADTLPNSGWQSLGLYTGGASAASGIVTVPSFDGPTSVSQSSLKPFTFHYKDEPLHTADIAGGVVSFAPGTAPDGCWITWDAAGGITVTGSSGTQFGYLGQAAQIGISPCFLDPSTSSLKPTAVGYDLTINIGFNFPSGTTHAISASGENNAGQSTALQQLGTLTVQNNLPSVSCSASPNPVAAGQSVTFTATGAGGTLPYTFRWSGTSSNVGSTILMHPQANTTETVTLTDQAGKATANSCSVSVLTPLTIAVPVTVRSASSATVTVTLAAPAPAGGAVVILSSTNQIVFPVPSTVSINAGQTTASVGISAGTVTTSVPVTVTASYNASSSQSSLSVTTTASTPRFTTTYTPDPVVDVPYSGVLQATDGTPPYSFSVAQGPLPPGLQVTSGYYNLNGTPTTDDWCGTVTFQVTDALGQSATSTTNMRVRGRSGSNPLTVSTPWALPTATAGVPFSTTLGVAGGTGPYSWKANPNSCAAMNATAFSAKPDWLSLNSSSGSLSGTPPLPGPYGLWLQVTDVGANKTQSQYFSLNARPAIAPTTLAPVSLEINLSAVPLDSYLLPNIDPGNSSMLVAGAGCTKQITVQQCFELMFSTGPNNWRAQGVTGVRFFFTMAGGYFSTPFDQSWNLRPAWVQNLHQFFADLSRWGIKRVTPTPVFDGWTSNGSGAFASVYYCQTSPPTQASPPKPGDPNPCQNGAQLLQFWPWLPYGRDYFDGNDPDRIWGNNSYNLSPANSYNFWNWTPFFNLMDTILAQARCGGLTPCNLSLQPNLVVDALDYFQEVNFADFTVEARMIYDPTHSVDVIAQLGAKMSKYGYDPLRVAPSAIGPATPSPAEIAAGVCTTGYGDSYIILNLSALTAAIYGNPIGLPANDPYCGPEDKTMPSLPLGHTRRTFIDMHTSTGADNYPDVDDAAMFSKALYDAIWAHLVTNGFMSDPSNPPKVIFGETNPVDNYGCSAFTYQQADAHLNGTGAVGGGLRNSDLWNNARQSLFMRSWHVTTEDQLCTVSPNVVNPPYVIQ